MKTRVHVLECNEYNVMYRSRLKEVSKKISKEMQETARVYYERRKPPDKEKE